MPALTFRPLETSADFRLAEALQRLVWSGKDAAIVPPPVFSIADHNGGCAYGAFDGDRLIGFVFGILGVSEGHDRPVRERLRHWSHMLAVLPEYRDQRVGYQLKLAQRTVVQAQGLDLIAWTCDPLESRNPHLNVNRLGAVCRTYLRNIYGEMLDELNAGLPSDRLLMEWPINSPRVAAILAGQPPEFTLEGLLQNGAALLNPARWPQEAGFAHPAESSLAPAGDHLLVEIPAGFQALKAADLGLAQAWRQHSRQVFEAAFGAGYGITQFFRQTDGGRTRCFYGLERSG